jgi:2-dehydro-3-deoxygalactonokinase
VSETALIAVDWGTTSLRAWRLDARGQILDRRRDKLGILQVKDGKFADALDSVAGDWLRASPAAPVLMAGMIGSRQGWVEAAYAPCPADLKTVAQHLARVPGQPRVRIVPGLSLRAGKAAPDVMRGEETQIFGLDQDGVVILPGTHSKWTLVRGNTVEWFATFFTGELYDVLKRHSILGRLMEEDTAAPLVPDGFDFGLREGLSGAASGLLNALFTVRTRGLFGEIGTKQSPGYLSGLLIGNEIKDALAALEVRGAASTSATLVGAENLTALYAHALARARIKTMIAGEDCSARGLFRIAGAAGLLLT